MGQGAGGNPVEAWKWINALMRKILTRLQAQVDVDEAANWYEHRRLGLGLRFLDNSTTFSRGLQPLRFSFHRFNRGFGVPCSTGFPIQCIS